MIRRAIRLEGLDAERRYRLKEINRGDRLHGDFDGKELTGRELMENGVVVEIGNLYDSMAIELAQ